jgi:hypothetical protein
LEKLLQPYLRLFYPEKGGNRLFRNANDYLQKSTLMMEIAGLSKMLIITNKILTLKMEVGGSSELLVTICRTYTLKMEVAGSSQTLVSTKVHGITSQATAIFIVSAVITSDLKISLHSEAVK